VDIRVLTQIQEEPTVKTADALNTGRKPFDCAVLLTDHRAFDYDLIVSHSDRLVDARNALGSRSAPGVVRLGAPLSRHTRRLDEDGGRWVA
jgi:UDP-N-acetyl-D-mannosaminuronate dehydrogenase